MPAKGDKFKYTCQWCNRVAESNNGHGKRAKYCPRPARCSVDAVAAKLRITNAKPENTKRFINSPKARSAMMAVITTDPRFIAGEQHQSAKEYQVRSPRGQMFRFRNMRHFVREHPELFTEEQRRPRLYKNAKNTRSRAEAGLCQMFSKSGESCSWHGWTPVPILGTPGVATLIGSTTVV